MDAEAVPHYLPPLHKEDFPRRFVFLDTETFREQLSEDIEEQHFRLASAIYERPSTLKGVAGVLTSSPKHYKTPGDLWRDVDQFAVRSASTVVWCHNLGFDIRISQALVVLPERGWHFREIRLGDELSYAVAVKEGKRLAFCDTLSWFAMSLEKLAKILGRPDRKVRLPKDDDDDEAWFKRCDGDVLILRDVWHAVSSFIQDNRLGGFRSTGAAQALSVYRHKFMPAKAVLVHDSQKLRDAERHASYAGRAEAFRYGIVEGPLYEMDFRHAYGAICADHALPSKVSTYPIAPRAAAWKVSRVLDGSLDTCESDILTLCTVTVKAGPDDLPVLPHRTKSAGVSPQRVLWPTGQFKGWWWGRELRAAEVRGQLQEVKVHEVHVYRLAPILRDWATWAIEIMELSPRAIERELVKAWTRSLVGRFGMRHVSHEAVNDVPRDNAIRSGLWINDDSDDENETLRTLQLGDQLYLCRPGTDGRNTVPQIMSYVMMLTRLRILDAIEAAGGVDNVIYCDTDGFITTGAGMQRLGSYDPVERGELRMKARYNAVRVLGAKQLILDGRNRISGVREKTLASHDDGSFDVESWERTGHALRNERGDRVQVRRINIHPVGSDGRRRKSQTRPGFTCAPEVWE